MAIFDPSHPDDLDRFPESARQCSFCGAPASAFWVGHTTIWCCHECAVTSLPALAGDAVVASVADVANAPQQAHHARDRFHEAYWRAVSIAIGRGRKQ